MKYLLILTCLCFSFSGCKKSHDATECIPDNCSGSLDCNENSYEGTYSGYLDFNGIGQSDEHISITKGSNANDGILEATSSTFGHFRIIINKTGTCGLFNLDSTSVTIIEPNLSTTDIFYKLHNFTSSGYFDGCSSCGANVLQFNNYIISDSSKNNGSFSIGVEITGRLEK